MERSEIELEVFKKIAQPVILLDPILNNNDVEDYSISFINEAAANLFEININRSISKSVLAVIPTLNSGGILQHLSAAFIKKEFKVISLLNIKINSKYFFFNVSIIPSGNILLIFDKIKSELESNFDQDDTNKRAHIINLICRSVAANQLNYSAVLKTISSLIAEYLNSLCFIRIISPDNKFLELKAVAHPDPEVKNAVKNFFKNYLQKIDEGLNGEVFRKKHTLVINELSEEVFKQIPEIYREYLIKYRAKAIAVIPLMIDNKVIGAINLAREIEKPPFNQSEIKFLEEISTFAALSITNAKLYKDKIKEIKERKKSEKHLKLALEKLESSNKSLQDFAYVTSHDLQEPLRMITSFTKLLEKKLGNGLDQDSKEFMFFIVDAAKRMQRMIGDILTYSRIYTRGNPFVNVDLNNLLKVVIVNLKLLIKENKAEINCQNLPDIIADETQMIQLFQNLIENSIKYRKENIHPSIELNCKDNESEYIFEIKDNGIGIDTNSLERIFIMFQKLNDPNAYPGSGIGLSICKRIIERHNGKIWVESEINKGTSVFFTLPKENNLFANFI